MHRTKSPRAQLALNVIHRKPMKGIPTWLFHVMEHSHIEALAGTPSGSYLEFPEETYLAFLQNSPICLLDQYIPLNPLDMGNRGYLGVQEHGATTGSHHVICDGIIIDSPESVVEHQESVVFPQLREAIRSFDEETRVKEILQNETALQAKLGPDILKSGYGFIRFPGFEYGRYGYENYFMAFALYPEVIERCFSLQADLALLHNRAAVRAYREGFLPPLYRLDHDMADSRGTLVNIKDLDRFWFPHFTRCLEPLLQTEVRLIWHCDGNLMEMVPRLLEVGLHGFQGFQYEDGMNYEKICQMKTRKGDDLIIIAGVSVTRTLPLGSPDEVRREMKWLVECGPKTGLFLGASSSITPGVPWENLRTLVEGFRYYQEQGRP